MSVIVGTDPFTGPGPMSEEHVDAIQQAARELWATLPQSARRDLAKTSPGDTFAFGFVAGVQASLYGLAALAAPGSGSTQTHPEVNVP
jgi:hypothetical protein